MRKMLPLLRLAGASLALVFSTARMAEPQERARGEDPSLRLYLAATAAAEASLRLHETAAAQRWLAEAPPARRDWEWRYLSAQADRSSARVDAEQGRVLDVAVSPDGRRIASAGADGSVKLWHLIRTIEHGAKPIVTSAWSRDGSRVFVGTWDDDVTAWDTATWEATMYLPPKDDVYKAVQGIALRADGRRLAVGAKDGVLRLWDVQQRRVVHSLVGQAEGQAQWVNDAAWLSESRLADAGSDGATVLWDWRAGQVRARLDHGRGRIVAAYHPGGSVIATGSSGRSITLWDAATGAKLGACAGHTEAVDVVAFSPDGARLASGGSDNTLRLWDWRSGSSVLSVPFQSAVYELAWSPDGTRIVAAVLDGTIVRLEASSARR